NAQLTGKKLLAKMLRNENSQLFFVPVELLVICKLFITARATYIVIVIFPLSIITIGFRIVTISHVTTTFNLITRSRIVAKITICNPLEEDVPNLFT
ncbi:hypothetical protein, partial [Colwellia sp. BRX10-5]|uniref:hypothetical protein n=1 Tax=Colwellia sp. BRX10-5 TaxID=2759842 RepID=UPI001C71099F